MRAPTLAPAPPRRTLLPALLALAVVAALSTPAGPRAEADGADRASARRATGAARSPAAAPRAGSMPAQDGAAAVTAAAPPASEPYRPDPRDPAHPGIPPPHAPGYDDVKTWDDPPPRRVPTEASPVIATETGAGSAGAEHAVPWPVLPTSWQNRQLAASVPRPAELADLPAAAADFLRTGRLSWWAVQAARDGRAARLLMLERDARGRWADMAQRLLASADDARGCALPRQLLVADFNRDDRPDLYVVCDGEPHLTWLSRADGRYVRIDTGYAGWAGAAEAVDVDGDGLVDIIATEDPRAAVLHGRGDGHFEARSR